MPTTELRHGMLCVCDLSIDLVSEEVVIAIGTDYSVQVTLWSCTNVQGATCNHGT